VNLKKTNKKIRPHDLNKVSELWNMYRYNNPCTGPEGSRRLKLPDFKTLGI
jgi:hypothetical protein